MGSEFREVNLDSSALYTSKVPIQTFIRRVQFQNIISYIYQKCQKYKIVNTTSQHITIKSLHVPKHFTCHSEKIIRYMFKYTSSLRMPHTFFCQSLLKKPKQMNRQKIILLCWWSKEEYFILYRSACNIVFLKYKYVKM